MEARVHARIDALGRSIEAMLLSPGDGRNGRGVQPTGRQMALQGKLAAAIHEVVDRPPAAIQRFSAPPSESASAATQPVSQAGAQQPTSAPQLQSQHEPLASAAQPSNVTETHGCGLLADRADGDRDEMRRQEAYFKQKPRQKPPPRRESRETKPKSPAEIKAGAMDEAPIGYGIHDA